MDREQFLEVYRHSLAHILAKAVMEIFGRENVQIAIGPQIADGMYYDFLLPRGISTEEFPAIEAKMKEIMKRREAWTRKEVTKAEALEIFKGQKYKEELIADLPEGETITVYYTGDDFVDLCRGPHVENSAELLSVAYKIRAVSSAYWRGDEKRDSLQRVYVYAFPDQQQLKAHLAMIREAQERDHKKLGKELDLFMFDETAPGMPYWLPRGWILYQTLLAYSRKLQAKHGYTAISAPLINKKKLWVISGHWAHYQNNMFMVPGLEGFVSADAEIPGVLDNPMDGLDETATVKLEKGAPVFNRDLDDTMGAKPMNCPNAMMTYKRTLHSYKELPIRYSEYDVLHRKEKSGQMNGLFRVQEFRQDDDHTFVAEDQIESEIADIIAIADEIYATFGVTYRAEFSTRPADFMGDIEVWNRAEAALKKILDDKYGEGGYEINEGDGAFYGPKIDLQIKDALGREWQCGTIQLDFQLPHNFGLTYVNAEGGQENTVFGDDRIGHQRPQKQDKGHPERTAGERHKELQRHELGSRKQSLHAGGDDHLVGGLARAGEALVRDEPRQVRDERQQHAKHKRQAAGRLAPVRQRDVGDFACDGHGIGGEERRACRPAQDHGCLQYGHRHGVLCEDSTTTMRVREAETCAIAQAFPCARRTS